MTEEKVAPMTLEEFDLDDLNLRLSGVMKKGSYKIVSTVPIIAYQFNPIKRSGTSDASLLLPVSSLSLTYDVVGTPIDSGNGGSYFTMVATADGTELLVEPSTAPTPGGPVPGAETPFTVVLDEGDVLQVATDENVEHLSMTGSRVTANTGHPVVMFSSHKCATVPSGVSACDHLEEQLPGMRFWGKRFVAARMPVRGVSATNTTDNVMWQIYAGEDDTTVSLSGSSEVQGLPFESSVLNRGESVEFLVSGTDEAPGDFYILSEKPIAVMQYMTGSGGPEANDLGDPAMVYMSPTEQFLSRYVVLVPRTWEYDSLVITRVAGVQVLLDGAPVSETFFTDVTDTGYQVGRIPVGDGVHSVESADSKIGINVIVVGYDDDDSYAYPGGMGIQSINIVVV